MTERLSPSAAEIFWQHERPIGRVHLWGATYDLSLRSHTQVVPASSRPEIIPVTPGPRTYLRGQATIAEPFPAVPRSVDDLPTAARAELDRVRVGDVQALYYPTDRVLVLRDCALLVPYREADPLLDPNHRALWLGTEDALLSQFPDATQIVTPAHAPGYARADYTPFLEAFGYQPLSRVAYGRTLLP